MNEKDLGTFFEKTHDMVIDPEAKKRAINAAMVEFVAADGHTDEGLDRQKKYPWHQGLLNVFRPTEKGNLSRKTKMKHENIKWLYGSVATASIIVAASFIALRTPNQFNAPEMLRAPLVVNEYEVSHPQVSDMSTRTGTTKKIEQASDVSDRLIAETIELDAGVQRNNLLDDGGVAKADTEDFARRPGNTVLKKELQAEQLVATSSSTAAAQSRQRRLVDGLSAMPEEATVLRRKPTLLGSDAKMSRPALDIVSPSVPVGDRERFENKEINPVKRVSDAPVSTFSIDVDTSSYSFSRRKINGGVLPQSAAVRIEEFINYFDYEYPSPKNESTPFSTSVIVGDSPWKAGNKLLHIGIQGYEVKSQPKSNVVFLLDVSGSMSSADKLPLLKQSISLLLEQLRPDDSVAIAVYAGAAGTVLEPTKVQEKQKILAALHRLKAGGSTAGAAGIKLAYQLAEQNFDKTAVNRIVLATDGDFNVGIYDPNKLKTFVERKRDKGIFLSVLGFGEGNYHDHMMQSLAQNGNGVAAYIDTLSEAQKVLVNEVTSSLFTIAKDVKIQVEFNPATVAEYRLIGYETRHLNREDFNNDKVDAGDIGSGHTVTAIYEITPVDSASRLIDESRYAASTADVGHKNGEYALLKVRYKRPDEDASQLMTQIVPANNTLSEKQDDQTWQQREYNFSAAVAGFAQLLKDDKYMGEWNYDNVIEMALKSRGDDVYGYRNEFVQLVRKAKIAAEM